jgi:aminomethyltransferase
MTQRTALYDVHVALGAKVIPFAGWDMPVRYTGDKEEHFCIREKVGVFDCSHMGEFIVRGPKALQLVQQVTSNDASKLVDGKAQYSCFPNHEGGIVDDCITYRIKEDQYMIVVNASNIEKDWNWVVETNKSIGAELINISDETSLLAVSGPLATAVVSKLTDAPIGDLEYYGFLYGKLLSFDNILIATTGYTGERTYEIFCRHNQVRIIWDALFEAGKEFGIQPCGLGARDTLRLEMGYMLYGNDINDTTSPLEAGLGWITKLNKGSFNGREVMMKLKEDGIKTRLVGFVIDEKGGIPRHDYEIASEGKVVGKVTSGSISPMTGQGIGMGYVPAALAAEGSTIDIMIRNKPVKARVVKPPFIRK